MKGKVLEKNCKVDSILYTYVRQHLEKQMSVIRYLLNLRSLIYLFWNFGYTISCQNNADKNLKNLKILNDTQKGNNIALVRQKKKVRSIYYKR